MPSELVQRRIDELLDQAEAAMRKHDWQQVGELARMVLSVDSENEDAQSFLTMVAEAGAGPSPADEPLTERILARREILRA